MPRLKGYIYLAFVLSCSFSIARVSAQDSYYIEEPHMSFSGGLIFGTNFAQVDGDTYWGYHKVGLNTGATVYIHFSKRTGISMDLLYSGKGSRAASTVTSQNLGLVIEQYHIDLNYIEIPITFHLRQSAVIMDERRVIDFELGASYARLINSSEWAQTDYPVVIDPNVNYFNTDDINGIIGASTKLYKNLNVNIRYQYSLKTIRPVDRVPLGFSYGNGQYNNVCVLRLVYYFNNNSQQY